MRAKKNYFELPDDSFEEVTTEQIKRLVKGGQNFLVLKRYGKLYLSRDHNMINYFDHLSVHLCNKCRHWYHSECSKNKSGIIPLDCVQYGYICSRGYLVFNGVILCTSFIRMSDMSKPRSKQG